MDDNTVKTRNSRCYRSIFKKSGGLHEWHLVSRTPQFKYWDISAEQIKDLRTLTSEVEFVNS